MHKGNKDDARSWFKRIFRRQHIKKSHKSTEAKNVHEPNLTHFQRKEEIQNSSNDTGEILSRENLDNLPSATANDDESASSPHVENGGDLTNVESSKSNFKNQLNVKLSSQPHKPVTSKLPAPSSSIRSVEDDVVAGTVASPGNTDPYLGVAMQRINLNRQRGARTPSKYSTDPTTIYDMTASDISFNASRDLGLISEETPESPSIEVKSRNASKEKTFSEMLTSDSFPTKITSSTNPTEIASSTPCRSSHNLLDDVQSKKKLFSHPIGKHPDK